MKKGPKCKLCGKNVQIMSYDSAYLKIVKPGESKASFVCWGCAEKLLGDKLGEITSTQLSPCADLKPKQEER